jgi:arylsulfatase A-like enzyme
MDVLFLVVDSLRAHPFADGLVAATPFLDALSRRSVFFSRAYATECWTLPSHASMFTGLMPSDHGAHFQTMAYRGPGPTLAERLSARGYATELATRNFVFDGTIPGINRGFARRSRIVRERRGWDLTPWVLAATKPRFRRHVRNTGFFHPEHQSNGEFLGEFARTLLPADDRLLEYAVERICENRSVGARSFLFVNLYDVHAPYPPRDNSLLRPWCTRGGMMENVVAPFALSRLGQHRYLRADFELSDSVRSILEDRYRAAVARMDVKLAAFFERLTAVNLLDDVLVILTSDHGEGFGEHGLFLHDASVFETHLHVPLWIMAPGQSPAVVEDVVSTRSLYELVAGVAAGERAPSILDGEFRARHPVAFAQHYRYPHLRDVLPQYTVNQFAAVGQTAKLVSRGGRLSLTDLQRDPTELRARPVEWFEGISAVLGSGVAGPVAAAVEAEAQRYAAAVAGR